MFKMKFRTFRPQEENKVLFYFYDVRFKPLNWLLWHEIYFSDNLYYFNFFVDLRAIYEATFNSFLLRAGRKKERKKIKSDVYEKSYFLLYIRTFLIYFTSLLLLPRRSSRIN